MGQNFEVVQAKGLVLSGTNVSNADVITDSSSHLRHPIPRSLPGPVLTPKYQAISPGAVWGKKNARDS